MNTLFKIGLSFVAFAALTNISEARDHRKLQIPQGSKMQCLSCHKNNVGDGSTLFKNQVENSLTKPKSTANVDWSKLYKLDADGDGFTNGQELGDPNGTWKIGDPDPDFAFSDLNDANSVPATSVDDMESYDFKINSVFPNPFTENNTLSYELKSNGLVQINVFTANGELVKNLEKRYLTPGQYSSEWNGVDVQGIKMPSGVYFIEIKQNYSVIRKKIILE